MECSHDSRAVCFLCSDQRPWWKEARVALGFGVVPPNDWYIQRLVVGKGRTGAYEVVTKYPYTRAAMRA